MRRTDYNERITQQRIKEIHQKQIFLLSSKNNGVSKAQIKRNLHVSFPSAAALADELLAHDVLVERGISEGHGRGRPSTILQVNSRNYVVPVVTMTPHGLNTFLFDLTGTLLEHGTLKFDYRNEKMSGGFYNVSAASMVDPIVQWIEQIKKIFQPLSLIISVYGSIINGVLSSSVLQIRIVKNIFSIIQEKTGIDVIPGNNATYYAYGEKQLRPDDQNFIFVYIGKGVGAGVIRDGRILGEGPARNGEIGHISIDYHGKPCACGNRGCLERYIGINAIEDDANMAFDEICKAYQKNDERLVRLLEKKAEQLAVGISSMLSMQFSELVIIGGKIQRLGPHFLETLCKQAKKVGMRKLMDRVSFEYAYVGNDGDAYGAFWDYMDHYFEIGRIMQ